MEDFSHIKFFSNPDETINHINRMSNSLKNLERHLKEVQKNFRDFILNNIDDPEQEFLSQTKQKLG